MIKSIRSDEKIHFCYPKTIYLNRSDKTDGQSQFSIGRVEREVRQSLRSFFDLFSLSSTGFQKIDKRHAQKIIFNMNVEGELVTKFVRVCVCVCMHGFPVFPIGSLICYSERTFVANSDRCVCLCL